MKPRWPLCRAVQFRRAAPARSFLSGQQRGNHSPPLLRFQRAAGGTCTYTRSTSGVSIPDCSCAWSKVLIAAHARFTNARLYQVAELPGLGVEAEVGVLDHMVEIRVEFS